MTDQDRVRHQFTDEERLRTSPVSTDHASPEHFTDEESTFLRHARYGALPARVPPEELVEMVETEPRPYVPKQPNVQSEGW